MSDSGATHVVHVMNRLDVGGLENGVVNLINRMPGERFRHTIVCLSGYDEDFRRRIRTPGVEVLSLGKRPGKDPAAYLRMWRVLRRLRPDIVHTRNFGTIDMQWVAAASRVSGRVHGEHGWEASDPAGRNRRNVLIRQACRPVVHCFAPMSQDISRWLQSSIGVPLNRIWQLYNGVDTARFSPAAPGDASRRLSQEGWDERAIVIGTVGRLDPVKNQRALIQAFAEILPMLPDCAESLHLAIVGEGPSRVELESLIQSLGLAEKVWLLGARSDIPDLLRSMDVFVLPSINEGISNTILEAMATGLPVVAGNVGGNPELVVDGLTGALYANGVQDGLREALVRYVTDAETRKAHGAAGRAHVVQNFSLESMIERYASFYDSVLRRDWPPIQIASEAAVTKRGQQP